MNSIGQKRPKETDLLDFDSFDPKKTSQFPKKNNTSSSLFNPDDILISLKNQPKASYEEDLEEEESSNLLGKEKPLSASASSNVFQAKISMQQKNRDYKSDNLSSADLEKNRSFF